MAGINCASHVAAGRSSHASNGCVNSVSSALSLWKANLKLQLQSVAISRVEDERHLVLHCPAYALERARLRSQLEAYRVHCEWMRLELSDEAR